MKTATSEFHIKKMPKEVHYVELMVEGSLQGGMVTVELLMGVLGQLALCLLRKKARAQNF
jgi:hypothetical protein